MQLGQEEFTNTQSYKDALKDCLAIQYMPESFFFSHKFNGSRVSIRGHKNSDGAEVSIPAGNKLKVFKNKRVLMLKARTNFPKWRGDLIIGDQDIVDSTEDLKQEEADVTTIFIEAGFGYDHGLVVTQPKRLLFLLDEYLSRTLTPSKTEQILSAPIQYGL